ncbi:hypothetical protein ACFWNK_22620 [Streptomyces sp. NPDC058417]|uniref:hypothetical protein n=1 Tax=unclassified Streptomyces TaxID=2593676 RepID=UPI0036546C78
MQEALGVTAALSGGAFHTTLVTTSAPGFVTCAFGAPVEVPGGWAPQRADLLVVPGGGRYSDTTAPAVRQLTADRGFLRRLGPRCHHLLPHEGGPGPRGATVIDARAVDDGDLITGAGVTSGPDVALRGSA